MKTVAIITAAGEGKRMGRPKQFIKLCGQTILERTVSVFEACKNIAEIILVVNKEDLDQAKKIVAKKITNIVVGGAERQDSIRNALDVLSDDVRIVAIHDGVRPFITGSIIKRAILEAKEFGAVVVGVPVVDTVKEVVESKVGLRTLDRSKLWAAQTPQVFRSEVILEAFSNLAKETKVTDDSMLVEKLGKPVKMVMGSYQNIKITHPEDLVVAEMIIKGDKK